MIEALTSPDPLIRDQGYAGLHTLKDSTSLLDRLTVLLYKRWKFWRRQKPGREYAWTAMSVALRMSVIAEENQGGIKGKIMAFERQMWERELSSELSMVAANSPPAPDGQ